MKSGVQLDMAYSKSCSLWQAAPQQLDGPAFDVLCAALAVCCCTLTVCCAVQDYLANAFKCLLLSKEGKAAKPLALAGVC